MKIIYGIIIIGLMLESAGIGAYFQAKADLYFIELQLNSVADTENTLFLNGTYYKIQKYNLSRLNYTEINYTAIMNEYNCRELYGVGK